MTRPALFGFGSPIHRPNLSSLCRVRVICCRMRVCRVLCVPGFKLTFELIVSSYASIHFSSSLVRPARLSLRFNCFSSARLVVPSISSSQLGTGRVLAFVYLVRFITRSLCNEHANPTTEPSNGFYSPSSSPINLILFSLYRVLKPKSQVPAFRRVRRCCVRTLGNAAVVQRSSSTLLFFVKSSSFRLRAPI